VKKKISGSIATLRYETMALSVSITNVNGIHHHKRNQEGFRGRQKNCPLCKSGSELEKKLGVIGA
jgi:hypothetical protein